MNKPIVRDSFFLSKKSEKATKVDLPIAQDLEDTLKANRTVRYQDKKFEEHTQTFSGYIAQIIQHECDHLDGILI